jgi:hypothetical protein
VRLLLEPLQCPQQLHFADAAGFGTTAGDGLTSIILQLGLNQMVLYIVESISYEFHPFATFPSNTSPERLRIKSDFLVCHKNSS